MSINTPPLGFIPAEEVDGSVARFAGPPVKGDGWEIALDWTSEDGVTLWPHTPSAAPQLTPAAAIAMGAALVAAAERFIE